MGQKAHVRGLRTGVTKSWLSERFASSKKICKKHFLEDVAIRDDIEKYYGRVGIAKVILRKTLQQCEIILFVAKSAVVIGKDGEKINILKSQLEKRYGVECVITVKQIKISEFSAKVMAEEVVDQLEKRMPYRRVAKSLIQKVMEKGAIGVKVKISGRLNGGDMTRTEVFNEGRISLQKLRADIDYHYITAYTKYGILGVKVRIYTNDIYTKSAK